jgi:protein phosphatase methylesterase 1
VTWLTGHFFSVPYSPETQLLPSAGFLSLDARGHGSTTITPLSHPQNAPQNTPLDLSLSTLTTDLLTVLTLTKASQFWHSLPPLLLIGHSLGGAVVTSLAYQHSEELTSLLGYAVLDVVEGSAIDALQSMQTYLSTRPLGFSSLASGIEWHIRSRTIRNSLSARVSVPGLLTDTSPDPRLSEDQKEVQLDPNYSTSLPTLKDSKPTKIFPWTWRTDLGVTQPFWEDWFVGLSKKFLEANGGKLLLLAGTDRLDKELMIGQMQGKYALQVFPEAGHFIHEDLPTKTAGVLVDFYKRNDRSTMVLPPKVSDLLRAGRKV